MEDILHSHDMYEELWGVNREAVDVNMGVSKISQFHKVSEVVTRFHYT
jgi:hypothetical protein